MHLLTREEKSRMELKNLRLKLQRRTGIRRDALEEMELPASVRGEALTLEQFAQLSNILDR